MSLSIAYMGTKRELAIDVSKVIENGKPGPILDVFSGMCAIGQSVGTNRNVWSNDIQVFAANVANALFTSTTDQVFTESNLSEIKTSYHTNKSQLEDTFKNELQKEKAVLDEGDLESIKKHLQSALYIGNSTQLDSLRLEYARQSNKFPYCLFSITFADSFFTLNQAIDIDSIRYAIDDCLLKQRISKDSHRWMLIALCHTAIKISATTGHFAQYLLPQSSNFKSYLNQRRRVVWDIWVDSLSKLSPVGTETWRRGNLVFNMDTLSLLERLSLKKKKPSIVYADPPYTQDQYSRYYHIWETLVKYDYPNALSKGRYREDRFTTPFSRATNIQWAFSELIRRTKALNSELILSYPENGLLHRSGKNPLDILRQHYPKVDIVIEYKHKHSTMGASKGVAKNHVNEMVYWARSS